MDKMTSATSAEDILSRAVLEHIPRSPELEALGYPETFGYRLRYGAEGAGKVEYATAKRIDDHFVLFDGHSVFGVADNEEDTHRRLHDRLKGKVDYENHWARGYKRTLEDRTQQPTTD